MSSSKYQQNKNTSSHPSGERVVVYHEESKDSIVLNPTGSIIWNSLENAKTKSEVVGELKTAFPDVAAVDLERDVEAYFTELLKNKLILATD